MFVVNMFSEHLFAKIHPFFHLVTFKSSNLNANLNSGFGPNVKVNSI